MTVPDPAVSVAFSPSGDFLASAHTDHVGVFLWTNRSMYTGVNLVGKEPVTAPQTAASLPTAQAAAADAADEADEDGAGGGRKADDAAATTSLTAGPATADADAGATADDDAIVSAAQLEGSLVTLSALPRSRWENLAQLDAIKLRNKPTEPPKAPPRAPFFLTTIPGLASAAFRPEEDPLAHNGGEAGPGSRVVNFAKLGVKSAMVTLLTQCHMDRDCACARDFHVIGQR